MKIKCVITDDEPIARKGLRGYIEKTDFLTLTGECENALQLNELLKKEQPELLFMDIEMPYINGIDFLSGIHNPPKVIITSAYEQYALKGYELNVTDYLLKPYREEKLFQLADELPAGALPGRAGAGRPHRTADRAAATAEDPVRHVPEPLCPGRHR